MVSYIQATLLGLLQGVSELFPISSLGHSVMIPALVGWQIDQSANAFLILLVATHFATALVLFVFFWREWKRIVLGILQSLRDREIDTSDSKLGWLLVVATIPAGILGLLFEERLKTQLAYANITAGVLVLNGIMLWTAEKLRTSKATETRHDDARIAQLSWWQAIQVGLLQSIALIPGFSRTGATITGGLLVGLSHQDAARFSFLLATPIIGAAALLKLPELLAKSEQIIVGQVLVAMVASAIAAYLTVRFLTRYFETETLVPFAVYCIAAGAAVLLVFYMR